MFLNTNIASMNAQRNVYQTSMDLDKSIERLSSGLRINTAADDASGLAIAEKMYTQRAGLSTAIQNTQDTSALFKIAEGALNQVGKMLSRIEELAVRAANQTLTSSDRSAITNEVKELTNQIDSISSNTEYNTLKLLNQNLDVKKSLSVTNTATAGTSGSLKIISTPDTIKNTAAAVLSVVAVASAAVMSGVATLGNASIDGVITINNSDIRILAADTSDTVVAKINAANSKTNVIAVQNASGVGAFISLISGKIDADAGNVIANSATVTNGSALGYTLVGASAHIVLSGDNTILSQMGLNALVGSVTGTNASVNLNGVAMTADDSKGNVVEMKNMGSSAYGLKVATDMFNGAFGAVVMNMYTLASSGNGGGALASAILHTSDITGASGGGDNATIDLNVDSRLRIQVGANYDQAISYSIGSMDSSSLGSGASSKYGSLADIQLDTATNANISIKVVQQAIKDVASMRSTMGAVLNRLDYTDKNLQVQRENMAAAESKIRDADISLEMTNFTKQQILMQAGTSMLAQANSKPQSILQLLK